MKEAYVSYDVAKLLRENGFNWGCNGHWYIGQSKTFEISPSTNPINWNEVKTDLDWLSCPTQQMACRWLREEHKIDISVTPDDGSWWIKITELESWSGVFDGKVLNSDDIKYAYEGDTSTKEDCYEAALQYVLTNLI